MVHGLIQAANKKNISSKIYAKKNNFSDVREWFKIKWKLALVAVVLLTSIFIFTGVVLYINLKTLGKINIHIIPYMNSQRDPYISPAEYFENDLQLTLNYIIDELDRDESRRFTLTEIYPLSEWWQNKSEEVRGKVRKFINEGRLEIAGGGWCAPDEAVVHYRSFIDQYTWGIRRLEQMAGRNVIPDVAFLMDNRGHSREIASLMKEMGIRGLMLGGINPQEQCYRKTYQIMEFLWTNGDIFGLENQKPNLYTSILDDKALTLNSYFAQDNPLVNIDDIINSALCQAMNYATNNIFVPIGGFFRYKNMKNTFRILDYIMDLINNNSMYKVNIVYSTPSYYMSSVEHNRGLWRRSNGDFLPFSPNKWDYWTGYYSSRPTLKYLERVSNLYFQVFKQILAFTEVGMLEDDNLDNLRKIIGLCQHHEGVAGASSQVTADYLSRTLHQAITDSSHSVNRLLRKLTFNDRSGSKLRYESCLQLNISQCRISEKNKNFVVVVYNPSSRLVSQYIRVPVAGENYLVKNDIGEQLESQMVHVPQSIIRLPSRERDAAKRELLFRVSDVPALGFKSFYVSSVEGVENNKAKPSPKRIRVEFDGVRNKIVSVERNGEKYPLSQEIMYYLSWLSTNSVFKPESERQKISENVRLSLLNDGELVTEYEQSFGKWASQIVRVYKDEDFVEINWVVGPIPLSFLEGKEIITSFSTNIKNGKTFKVDVNGRKPEMKCRDTEAEIDFAEQQLSRSYRPVNSHISISDSEYQLHIFNDRPQGGVTAEEGELELMMHRRLINVNFFSKIDDLNERQYNEGLIAAGRHWVFIGGNNDLNLRKSIEDFSMSSHSEVWTFFAGASDVSFEDWTKNYVNKFSSLKDQLPKPLRILSLEPWNGGELLIRLEHTGEDGYGKATVNLKELFSRLDVRNATQVTLAGTNFKKDSISCPKFVSNAGWNSVGGKKLDNLQVTLYPEDIRTFILQVTPR